jgi:hypothetical protein
VEQATAPVIFDYDVSPRRAGAVSPARRTFSQPEQQKIADAIVKDLEQSRWNFEQGAADSQRGVAAKNRSVLELLALIRHILYVAARTLSKKHSVINI